MAQFGPHRFDAGDLDHDHTDAFRGEVFEVRDLTGARFVDCDLTGVRVVDAALVDVELSGYVEGLTVNGVDVTAYVDAELDRRHPERAQLREIDSADAFRRMWQTVEQLWADDVSRAAALPESARQERVAGEWSFVETLRHLVFITDSWVSRTILDEEAPFHPLGLPPSWFLPADVEALGLLVEEQPSYEEVLAARADRLHVVRRVLEPLTDADLGRACPRPPAPNCPDEPRPVAECLYVLMEEEIEHHRFAVRDLAVLEGRG